MIGKAKSNKSLQATIAYNEKEKADLIYTNKLAGTTLEDYRMQMEDLQKCYPGYGKQLTIHAILSPGIEDGKALSKEQWQKIASGYLTKMGLQEQQAIGFLHRDKEHRHLHLVINKVKEDDLKVVHDGFIGKKSQKIADEIAKEMKLVRAMEIRQNRINDELRASEVIKAGIKLPEEKPVGTKQHFKAILDELLKVNYQSVTEYFKALEKAGFVVHSYQNKETGELRGYGIEKDGTKLDASAISKKFTLKALKIPIGNSSEIDVVVKPHEAKSVTEAIIPLIDEKKIAVLENFSLTMGVRKETLDNNRDIEMIEYGKEFFVAMKNDSGGYTANNMYSKKYLGENDISTRVTDKRTPTYIVEDTFAYLLHKQKNLTAGYNYIILNAVTNKDKLITKIAELNLRNIKLHLNNSSIGKLIAQEIGAAIKKIFTITDFLIKGKKDADKIENEPLRLESTRTLKEKNNINNTKLK